MTRPLVIAFAKTPRIGHGKTRLAREIGAVEAWRANRWMQARTLRALADPRWTLTLAVTPDQDAGARLPGVWGEGLARRGQGRGDLGARLARALAAAKGPVAVVGVDCPSMRAGHVWSAFRALREASFALGPAEDGGFWLLAARSGREAAPAMAGVRWSTPHAAADVLARLPDRCARLARLADVDDSASLAASRRALYP